MEFRLVYEGPLLGQSANAGHKWEIRRFLHPQLERLWENEPLAGVAKSLLALPAQPSKSSNIRERSGVRFAPLVTRTLKLFAEISILLFRPGPRDFKGSRRDADNQLKTLIDALRLPNIRQEIPKNIAVSLPSPFYCLLEDDSLVTKVGIETEQWLSPEPDDKTLAIIHVCIKKSVVTYGNIGL